MCTVPVSDHDDCVGFPVRSVDKQEGNAQDDKGTYALKRIRKDLVIHKNEVTAVDMIVV